MKLSIEPRQRRSWDCVITDGTGGRVATTARATPAALCGLISKVYGAIVRGNGAPAAALRVEAHEGRWLLVDKGGRHLCNGARCWQQDVRHNLQAQRGRRSGRPSAAGADTLRLSTTRAKEVRSCRRSRWARSAALPAPAVDAPPSMTTAPGRSRRSSSSPGWTCSLCSCSCSRRGGRSRQPAFRRQGSSAACSTGGC